MDQRDGGCEVLAADSHRDPQPRGAGYSDCVCGWVEGVPGGNPERIPQDTGAAVHRTHGAQQPELRELERTKNGGGGFEAGVPCGNRRGSRATAVRVRAEMEPKILLDRADVAPALGRNHTFFCLPGRAPASGIYHPPRGITKYEPKKSDQDEELIARARVGAEAIIPVSQKCI